MLASPLSSSPWSARLVALAISVATMTGCAAEAEEETESDSAAVIGGTETKEAPQVGMASFSWGTYCTATLIGPRVAITAGHCVKYNSGDVTGSYGRFKITQPSGTNTYYTIDRYRSFPRDGLGSGDVALLRLATEVPSTIAVPAPLATANPSSGTDLVLYGYGCNDNWEDRTGGGVKRRFYYDYGTTLRNTLCPGDSGGPVIIRSTGAVLLINSGWKSDWWSGRRDVFGEVPKHTSQIASQRTAWAAADPTTGLRAEYFDNENLSGLPRLTRYDATVNFDWSSGSPINLVEGDTFSARWQGKLVPPTSETWTLEVLSDDGVRLYVDNALVIDDWVTHSPTSHTARLTFTAGSVHDIKLEYFEKSGGAVAKLYWSSPTRTRQILSSAYTRPK